MVRLTRKASLIAARAALPSSLEDVKEGAILPGFIASATPVCTALEPNFLFDFAAMSHEPRISLEYNDCCHSQLTFDVCCDTARSHKSSFMYRMPASCVSWVT